MNNNLNKLFISFNIEKYKKYKVIKPYGYNLGLTEEEQIQIDFQVKKNREQFRIIVRNCKIKVAITSLSIFYIFIGKLSSCKAH